MGWSCTKNIVDTIGIKAFSRDRLKLDYFDSSIFCNFISKAYPPVDSQQGIVYVGAEVKPGDILVGKVVIGQ